MTQSEWLTATDPQMMLVFLHTNGTLSERKGRLFAVACCRRLWHHLEEPSRRAVHVIERLADGRATERERAAAEAEATGVSARLAGATIDTDDAPEPFAAAAVLCLTASTGEESSWLRCGQFIPQQVAQHALIAEWQALGQAEVERLALVERIGRGAALTHLLREVFGNPFKPVNLDVSVLAWNDHCVPKLAAGIYAERDFSPERMGVLGDALEEAGVTDAGVLSHCRQEGTVHVRGCWLVDLLTGRE